MTYRDTEGKQAEVQPAETHPLYLYTEYLKIAPTCFISIIQLCGNYWKKYLMNRTFIFQEL